MKKPMKQNRPIETAGATETSANEERDREGYLRQPQSLDEVRLWEAEAVWPAEPAPVAEIPIDTDSAR